MLNQIENAAKVIEYSASERAAYEHGVRWGMKRAAEAIRLTGMAAGETGVGPLVGATCNGLADALEKQAAEGQS